MHTYIHTMYVSIHIYNIHTYIHTYIQYTYIHTYIHKYNIHTYILRPMLQKVSALSQLYHIFWLIAQLCQAIEDDKKGGEGADPGEGAEETMETQ